MPTMRFGAGWVILLYSSLSGLTGCAVTSLDGQRMTPRSDAFADYVEAVFRRQNELSTELANRLDGEPPHSDRFRALEAAELELLQACRGLNQMARAQRAGEAARGLAALKRARQAPDCERATETAALALKPATAAAGGLSR